MPAGERAKDQTLTSRPWIISGLTLAADQLTKWLITGAFAPGHSQPLLGPVLHLTYVQNTGAAFGLFKGQQLLFIVCSVAIMGWILREFLTGAGLPPVIEWGYALVLGGAAGNLIDRARLGYVIDFLDLGWWPVFNVGDSAITIGVVLLIWHAIFDARHRNS